MKHNGKSISKSIEGLFIFFIFFVGAFRDASIGTDIAMYDDGYHMIWLNPYNYVRDIEPGFSFLTYIIKFFSSSYYFYYGLLYIVNILLYCKACKILEVNKSLFLSILLLSGLLAPSFNVVRQMLGLSAGILFYSIIESQYRSGKYRAISAIIVFEIGVLILSYLIHNSLFLLMMIPIFYIPKVCNLLNKDIILWGILGVSVFLSLTSSDIIQNILTASTGLFGERADFYVTVYTTYHDSIKASHGFMTSLLNGALVILLSKGKRDNLFYIGFVGLMLQGIAASGLGTIGRAFNNLSIFLCIYYARYWFTYNTSWWLFGLKLLRIVVWLSSLYYTLFQNESLNPYKTFIF